MKNGTSGLGVHLRVALPVDPLYEFAGHTLDLARRRLTGPDGADIVLSNKSFDALGYLLEHPGKLVGRDELMRALWPKRVVEANNLNQAIAGLRRALGESHIVTVAGRGYQWVTPVLRITSADGDLDAEEVETAADAGPRNAPRPASSVGGHRIRRIVVAAAVLVLGVLASAAWLRRESPEQAVSIGPLVSLAFVTTYPGAETMPAMSPDGTRVAFSWRDGSDARSIYWTALGTTAPIRLTLPSEGSDEYPAWSPNGEQIAFLRRYDPEYFDLMTISVAGGGERRLYSGRMYWISVEGFPLLAWTPDGTQLLFTSRREQSDGADQRYTLHRLTVATGAVDPAVSPVVGGYDTSPAVSPDGAWLAFTRYLPGERLNTIMLQRLGENFAPVGEAQPIRELAPSLNLSLHWGAASDRLYFGTGGKIVEWRTTGATRTVYTWGPTLSAPLMSMIQRPSGARAAIVAQQTNAEIFALPLDPVTHEGVGASTVRVPSTGIDYHPRFSPDGTKLAFVSDRNNGVRALWIADANGRNARQLTELDEFITGFPRWSPDGTRIAFHTSAANEERVIYEVDVRTGRTVRLFNGCCPGGWSADGRYLYLTQVTSGINQVERVDVSSGTRETLFEGETPIESADGQYLLYSKAREPGYFRRSLHGSIGTNVEERLVDDYRPTSGGLAPVTDGFFYVGFAPEGQARAIRFYDYARAAPRDIAAVPANVLIGLTLSPDGRELLYAATGDLEADIRLYEFATEGSE